MSQGFGLDLADPERSGVYAVESRELDSIAALARSEGLRVLRVDLSGCHEKRMLLARLAAQLDFPRSFGRNWDALSDALADLSWKRAEGYALLLDAADGLRQHSADDFQVLLEILDEVANRWRGLATPFVTFLGLDVESDSSD